MNSQLLGKWKLCKCENVDEYMQKCSVNFFFRKLAANIKYDLEFVNEPDGLCKIIMTSTFKNDTTAFKLNEEFEEKDMTGKDYMTTFFEREGVLLVAKRLPKNPEHPTIENTFYINDEGDLVNTGTITSVDPPVTSYRYMKRIGECKQ